MGEGAALLMTAFYELRAQGLWSDAREANLLDGGAPFYGVYRTADDGFIAVGPLEPQFHDEFLYRLGLGKDPEFARRDERALWPGLRRRLEALFATRPRAAWEALFADSDACVAPVLSMCEAPDHPHARARCAFASVNGVVQPAPAPRFSATPLHPPRPPAPAAPEALLAARPPAALTSEMSPC